jgi:hypothetical protein
MKAKDAKAPLSAGDILRTFGFVVIREFFDTTSLTEEIDRVMRRGVVSQQATHYSGINFQYVPMMTAETPVSLTLLDRVGALAESLLGGPVLPTRAKGTRYFGNTPWHTDSESPVPSIGFIAYCESLDTENGALRVIPGSHHREYGGAIRELGAETVGIPSHVVETQPGDLILIDEHLFHASSGGAARRQWRVDYLRLPVGADEETDTKAYFANIYPAEWDGGYELIGTRVMDPIGEIPADLLQHNSKGLVCMIWQPDRRHLPGQEGDANRRSSK